MAVVCRYLIVMSDRSWRDGECTYLLPCRCPLIAGRWPGSLGGSDGYVRRGPISLPDSEQDLAPGIQEILRGAVKIHAGWRGRGRSGRKAQEEGWERGVRRGTEEGEGDRKRESGKEREREALEEEEEYRRY